MCCEPRTGVLSSGTNLLGLFLKNPEKAATDSG